MINYKTEPGKRALSWGAGGVAFPNSSVCFVHLSCSAEVSRATGCSRRAAPCSCKWLGMQEPSLHSGTAKWNSKVLLWLQCCAVWWAGSSESCRDPCRWRGSKCLLSGVFEEHFFALPSPASCPPVVFCACPVGHTSLVSSP